MEKNPLLVGLVLFFGIIAAASLIQFTRSPSEGGDPRIHIKPESYDFGDIPRKIVKTTFIVENIGGSVLEITSVSTSCGCTKAKTSKEKISTKETAKLFVEMDPNVMGNITGEVERTIYVKSNDPDQPEIEVKIWANILG